MRFISFCVSIFFIITAIGQNQKFSDKIRLNGNGMKFTQNKGQVVDMQEQVRPDVLFKSNGGSSDVYIRKTGISYVLSNASIQMQEVDKTLEQIAKVDQLNPVDKQKLKIELLNNQRLNIQRVDVDFLDCNINQQTISTGDQLDGYDNFYYANCPAGITHVPSYNKVFVKNIYNKIDIVYYGGKQKGLKYDIVVNPGGNPDQLKLKYSGIKELYIRYGKLYLKTEGGEMEEQLPEVYQTINGKRKTVEAHYLINPVTEKNGVGLSFQIAAYDHNYPLIIDPWITYFGGNTEEQARSIALDKNKNVILSAYASGVNFPVTAGAYQTTLAGITDAAIVKFSSAGTLLFATYFGGSKFDDAAGIATDNSNNIFLTGYTVSSADFPVLNPGGGAYYQPVYGGNTDAYVAEFSSTGTLLWSTFYGGNVNDIGTDIVVDASDNIIMTGSTGSANFPVKSAYNAVYSGVNKAYIVKFNSSRATQWATFYGGSGFEAAYGIAADAAGDIVVCGETTSSDFPAIAAYQSASGGSADGFVVKLSGAAGVPVWSTYYGGSSADLADAIAVDGLGNVCVQGSTESTNGIASAGAFQSSFAGGLNYDAFVVKFNNSGTRQWATYLGGSSGEEQSGIACDVNNNIIISGDTYSTDFPVTACAYQTIFKGNEDQYITTFDPAGNLLCSGYLGDGGSVDNETTSDVGGCIVTDDCYLYLHAYSDCNYPVTAGAYQTICGSGGVGFDFDLALAKLYINTCGGVTNKLNATATKRTICPGSSVDFRLAHDSCGTTASTFLWKFPGGNPSASILQNPTGIVYPDSGTYDVKLYYYACDTDSLILSSYISVSPLLANTFGSSTTCGIDNGTASVIVSSGGTAPYTYLWNTSATDSAVNGLSPGTYHVTVTDSKSCSVIKTITIGSSSALSMTMTSSAIVCNGDSSLITLTVSGGSANYTYSWNGSSVSSSATSFSTWLKAGSYSITITDAANCTVASTVLLTDPSAISVPAIAKTDASCGNNNGTATATASGGTGSLTYTWSTASSGQTITGLFPATYIVTVKDANGCSVSNSVIIGNGSSLTIQNSSIANVFCNGESTGKASVKITGGSSPYTYLWSNAASATTTSLSDSINALTAGIYIVTITDHAGCTTTATFNVTEPPALAVPSIQITNASCGINNGMLTANSSGGTGALTYSWSNIISGSEDSLLSEGTYTLTVTDANSCTITATSSINNLPGPVAEITAAPTTITEGNTVLLIGSSVGGTSFTWTPASSLSCSNCVTPVASPSSTTTYTLYVKDVNGCVDSASITITIKKGCADEKDIYIANVFSPNADGKNDVLNIEGDGLTNIYWAIYDRWGNLLFDTTDLSLGWDGTNKGSPMGTGTYVYYLKATCIKTNTQVKMKGNVSIFK